MHPKPPTFAIARTDIHAYAALGIDRGRTFIPG